MVDRKKVNSLERSLSVTIHPSSLGGGYRLFTIDCFSEAGTLHPQCFLRSGHASPATILSEKNLERETGFEPATSTLARLHSTAELFPRVPIFIIQSHCPVNAFIALRRPAGSPPHMTEYRPIVSPTERTGAVGTDSWCLNLQYPHFPLRF